MLIRSAMLGKVVDPDGNAPSPAACKAAVLSFITTSPEEN